MRITASSSFSFFPISFDCLSFCKNKLLFSMFGRSVSMMITDGDDDGDGGVSNYLIYKIGCLRTNQRKKMNDYDDDDDDDDGGGGG